MTTVLSPSERRDWVRLSRTDMIGPVAFSDLMMRFGGPTKALANLPKAFRNRDWNAASAVPSVEDIEAELEAGAVLGARLLLSCDPDYPEHLAALDAPPPLLWTLGDADLLRRPSVAIVGARIASAAGQRFARTLAQELGDAGFIVVSGLARGVDGAGPMRAPSPTELLRCWAAGLMTSIPAIIRSSMSRLSIRAALSLRAALARSHRPATSLGETGSSPASAEPLWWWKLSSVLAP